MTLKWDRTVDWVFKKFDLKFDKTVVNNPTHPVYKFMEIFTQLIGGLSQVWTKLDDLGITNEPEYVILFGSREIELDTCLCARDVFQKEPSTSRFLQTE